MGRVEIGYVCSGCGGPLRAQDDTTALVCAGCPARVPIVDGIPRFVPSEGYAASFGYQWNRHARTQIDRYNGYTFSHERFFVASGWPRRLEGETILEAGCGAGRFTEVALETGAEVWSFDATTAVDANRANNGEHPRLHLFQANIDAIPLPHEAFDRVYCFGVLQHTANPERAFTSLVQMVKPGGAIAVDIYKKHWQTAFNTKYWVRAFTRGMDAETLHTRVERWTPRLLRVYDWLSQHVGAKVAFGLVPVSPAVWPGLRAEDRLAWSILDTFDMYAPTYDQPQTLATMRRWMAAASLQDVVVEYGPNGIVARGRKAARS